MLTFTVSRHKLIFYVVILLRNCPRNKIALVASRLGQFCENFKNAREINPLLPSGRNPKPILMSFCLGPMRLHIQIGARAAKVSNKKVSNNKVRLLRMRTLFIWFLVVTKYSLIFLNPSDLKMPFCLSDDKSLVGFALSIFFLEFCYTYD